MIEHLKLLALAALAALAPLQSVCTVTLVIVLFDLLTGLMRARKRRKAITSGKLKRTVVKLFVYQTAILAAYLVGTYLTGPTIPVCNIIAGFIGLTELKSVLENLDSINKGSGLLAALNKQLTGPDAQSQDKSDG